MASEERQKFASDFVQRLLASAAKAYPDLPITEAVQLKAHDLAEAGMLTESEHHDLFLVAAREILDASCPATPEVLAQELAANVAAGGSVFSLEELERFSKIAM